MTSTRLSSASHRRIYQMLEASKVVAVIGTDRSDQLSEKSLRALKPAADQGEDAAIEVLERIESKGVKITAKSITEEIKQREEPERQKPTPNAMIDSWVRDLKAVSMDLELNAGDPTSMQCERRRKDWPFRFATSAV